MKQSKLYLLCIMLLLVAGCQPTARFTNNKSSRASASMGDSKADGDNKTSTSSNVSKYYDSKAKIIKPRAMMHSNSNKIVSIAEKWLGVSYVYGGNTRAGVDCSGFVKNVFQELGIILPRTSAQQFTFLKPTNVPFVGDLVFFKKGGRINHVGIYLGDDKIIHSSSGKGVIKQNMKGTSLERNFAGYRSVASAQKKKN